MPFKPFSRKQRTHSSRPATSDDQPPAHGTTATSLAVLKEGSSLATKFPFIAPGRRVSCFKHSPMRDEVKQYKQECKIVMYKLARIAKIIVNVCEKYNLSEEELPATLRDILGSLQRTRELDRIGRVLEKCSKRKGLKGVLLRKDLLTKIKQCDVELSNVLQAFQTELGLDIRFALVVQRREVNTDSGPIETTPFIPQKSNAAQIFRGILDALRRAGEPIVRPSHFGTSSDRPDLEFG
ncbi:hypothetical protein EDB89DRAFT_2072594 [Lactarius sanguifluus]|nr:hypothetical protein EDB89DRAFT_2072594 [Lactarius sanguifluus]